MRERWGILVLGWILGTGAPLAAQQTLGPWAVEVDLVQAWIPGVQIVLAKAGVPVSAWGNLPGELWLGVYLRPGVTDH